MSWVEVPDDVKMPETTTYKRWKKRQNRFAKEHFTVKNSSQEKYTIAMNNYYHEQKRMKRVNQFRQKHGRAPLAMPRRPKKASFGLKGGGKASSDRASG